MFRFVSTNALQSLRPVLLQNLRNNPTSLLVPSNALNNNAYNTGSVNLSTNFQRFNSYNSTGPVSVENYDDYIEKLQQDPVVNTAIKDETRLKLNYFKEQVFLFHQYKKLQDESGRKAFSSTCHNILNSFDDQDLRAVFNRDDLERYVKTLSFSIYHNRTSRLTGNKNIDKDQRSSDTTADELFLKNSLLKLKHIILTGELKNIMSPVSLHSFFSAMNQFQLYEDSIDVWEIGVNDSNFGSFYLNDKVLSVILPIAYKINRFSYDEINRIFELNTANSTSINPLLLTSMGKVAISAGDYTKGLDNLEALIKMMENSNNQGKMDYHLGDLHLSFIGSSKNISIAKHFFDKVIQYDLPYNVKLKVPYIQSLLQNCVDAGESFDTMLYFWKSTIHHYRNDKRVLEINSRYSILNNAFFKIFFDIHSTLTAESFNQLKEVINVYNEIKGVDEVFLNTLVSNYTWKDRAVYEQLLENYDIFAVSKTQVSYRVTLKNLGTIKLENNDLIVNKWHESLKSLDQKKFNYIPIADWASIRDSTIRSTEYKSERTELYWQVLATYKNYFQNEYGVARFIDYWLRADGGLAGLKSVVNGEHTPLETPSFTHLTPSVDFNRIFHERMSRRR